MRNSVVAGLGGLIVGNGIGAICPLPEPPPIEHEVVVLRPGPRVAAPQVTDERPCPDLRDSQLAALDAAWAALDEAEAEERALEATVADLIGEPPGFDTTPDALLPDRIEDTVREQLDPELGELQWVDCEDAPCIAVIRMLGPDSDEVANMREVGDRLRDAVDSELPWEWFGVSSGDYMTVPLGPGPNDPRFHHRTDLREELIISELVAAGLAE